MSKFIRRGQDKIKTCYLAEATLPGAVLNIQDFTEFDQGDTDLGVLLNGDFWETNAGTNVVTNQRSYFVPLYDAAGCEVIMTEVGGGTISAGAYVKVTTGGKIATWTQAEIVALTNPAGGEDWVVVGTMRDVIGRASESIATSSTGWVRLGRV